MDLNSCTSGFGSLEEIVCFLQHLVTFLTTFFQQQLL